MTVTVTVTVWEPLGIAPFHLAGILHETRVRLLLSRSATAGIQRRERGERRETAPSALTAFSAFDPDVSRQSVGQEQVANPFRGQESSGLRAQTRRLW